MRIKTINFLYLFLGLLGFKASPATAALYLCAPEIKGDVTATRYADCVDVSSWQWGGGRGIPSGGTSDANLSALSVAEVTITKETDSSSVDFVSYLRSGSAIAKMELSYDECGECPGSDSAVKLELTNVRISGYSQSTGGVNPSESVSLNMETVNWCFANPVPDQPMECVFHDLRKP